MMPKKNVQPVFIFVFAGTAADAFPFLRFLCFFFCSFSFLFYKTKTISNKSFSCLSSSSKTFTRVLAIALYVTMNSINLTFACFTKRNRENKKANKKEITERKKK